MRARKRFAALTAAILTALSGAALAQEYDAQQAKSWMAQFAQALLQFSPINDPAQTRDPARPGEYLQEYEFEGKKLMGTRDYDTILKYIYNDYMKLPPEDKRDPHAPVSSYFFG